LIIVEGALIFVTRRRDGRDWPKRYGSLSLLVNGRAVIFPGFRLVACTFPGKSASLVKVEEFNYSRRKVWVFFLFRKKLFLLLSY